MKFRRNIKEEKLCKIVAIVGLLLLVVSIIAYLMTFNEELIEFMILLFVISPIYFFLTYLLKNCFVEFYEDKIALINGNRRDIEISIADIEAIWLPSPLALKKKIGGHDIIIKRKDTKNILSYSTEIAEYIKENVEVHVEYYDFYGKALRS